jgi:hypothetical protein
MTGKLKVNTVFNNFHTHVQETELRSLKIAYTGGRNALLVYCMPHHFYFAYTARNCLTLFYNDHNGSSVILLKHNI